MTRMMTFARALPALALLLMATSLPAAAQSAPAGERPTVFGVTAGMPIAQLLKVAKPSVTQPGLYTFHEMPARHPDFESVVVVASRQHGVCKVIAIGVTHTVSAYGTELLTVFDRLVETLTSKYGKAQRFDFLQQGSIWDEPRDWMMGLHQGERKLMTVWGDEGGAAPGMGLIALQTETISHTEAYVNAAYEFDTFGACKKVLERETDAVM